MLTKKMYWLVFGWLGALTAFEVWAVSLDLPRLALVVLILGTAFGKALLIALYFMHLKFENRLVWLLPAVPVCIAVIFVAALFPDIVFHLTFNIEAS